MDIRARKLTWIKDYLGDMYDSQLIQKWNDYEKWKEIIEKFEKVIDI